MDWNDLRYFLAVASARSLMGAARDLGVNHSTVFRRINRFEETVGARLFDRLADGYHLTQAGEELLSHAFRIGEEVDLLQLKILGSDYRPSGKVRLTAPDNIAYAYLPDYLQSFSEKYPEITFELDVGAQSLDLTRREADVAVRATTSPPPHLVGREVLQLEWAFFASPSYVKQYGRPEDQASLAQGHRLIGADGSLRRIPPFKLVDANYRENVVIACSTLNAMSAMAESGYAIALLPDDQIKAGLVRLFPLAPQFKSGIWLLTHPELRFTERIRLLMEHLYHSFRADDRLLDVALFPGAGR